MRSKTKYNPESPDYSNSGLFSFQGFYCLFSQPIKLKLLYSGLHLGAAQDDLSRNPSPTLERGVRLL
jgi:hypothetical protein